MTRLPTKIKTEETGGSKKKLVTQLPYRFKNRLGNKFFKILNRFQGRIEQIPKNKHCAFSVAFSIRKGSSTSFNNHLLAGHSDIW